MPFPTLGNHCQKLCTGLDCFIPKFFASHFFIHRPSSDLSLNRFVFLLQPSIDAVTCGGKVFRNLFVNSNNNFRKYVTLKLFRCRKRLYIRNPAVGFFDGNTMFLDFGM